MDTANTRPKPPTYRLPVYRVMLVKDSSVPALTKSVRRPEDADDILRSFLAGLDREHLAVLLLDRNNRVIGLHTVSIGSLSETICESREVFKAAILANAAAIICAHNHPSGNVTPSEQDVVATRRLVRAGRLLNIPLLDHLIVTEEESPLSIRASFPDLFTEDIQP